MAYTVQNLCGFLIRSRLLSADEVRALYQRWRREAGDTAAQSAQFLKWIVARRYVTEYQASLLGRGLPDNFFLNQYKIVDRIGQGSMAGVYRAVHPLGQEVAIKVLPPSRAKNPRVLARFQREARLAVQLKHPNIVRAFHVGEADGLHFIVMEYLEGETLEDVLTRRTRLPPEEAVRLVHQVLAGLQHIHEQGLIHRDLKPSNLMLVPARPAGAPDTTAHATVKILDIGLGRALFDETLATDPDQEMLTGEGVLLGTPNYLSPEQARDAHKVDIRTDIYSLGCVLYHLLAGRPPFVDTNALSQMVRHLSETPRPLRELNPAVPDGLQQIIDWMLAKDPNQRYQTPERAAQALQVYLAAGSVPSDDPEANPKTQQYLNWLAHEEAASPEPASTARPAVEPVVKTPAATIAPAIVTTAAPVRSGEKRRRATSESKRATSPTLAAPAAEPVPHRSRKRDTNPTHPALATATAAVPMAAIVSDPFDVELLPLETPTPTVLASLTRRDLLMLAAGSGVTLVLIGLTYALIWLVL